MIHQQFPARAIRRRFKPVSDADMLAQHHAAITALKAHHIVTLHRAPDRYYRDPRLLRPRDTAQTTKRSMYLGDQSRELINADLVMPQIALDNPRDEPRIELTGGVILCHRARLQIVFPLRTVMLSSLIP
jgi:hypothetical protein